jgi:hypothetical protein
MLVVIGFLKGRVHPQKIFLKYVMLRTVTKNSTILTPDSKVGRRKIKCSDITLVFSRLMWIMVSLEF